LRNRERQDSPKEKNYQTTVAKKKGEAEGMSMRIAGVGFKTVGGKEPEETEMERGILKGSFSREKGGRVTGEMKEIKQEGK